MELESFIAQYSEQLKKIKVCAFDVDGVLTDGKIWWAGDEVGWNRYSHSRDGYGLKVLKSFGLKVGVITGGNSIGVTKRYKENLGLDFVFKGKEDKRDAFKELMNQGHEAHEILYMGDELFDIPLLKKAGFSATVPNASLRVKDVVDYVTVTTGGNGAVREVVDLFCEARGFYVEIPDFED